MLQLINKNNATRTFTKVSNMVMIMIMMIMMDDQEDEELITEFATFICLDLHHAKLYDKLRRSENSVAVAHEVKAYHAQAKMDEVEEIVAEGPPNPEDNQDVSSQM